MKKKFKKCGWAIIPIFVMVLILVLFRVVLMIGYVPTSSMEPTIEAGSYVLGLRSGKDLQADDIIIFWHEGSYLVKRIFACGGDKVCHKGQVLIVPEGCFYVLGDNAEDSFDSRYWEDPFVKTNQVVAIVVWTK